MNPETPAHLDAPGAALYAATVAAFELSLTETAALLQACETVDTLAELEAAVREHGRVTATGRPSPLLVELRQQRATLVRLFGLLDLREDADEDDSQLSTSRAARAAARARWSKQLSGKGGR